MYISVQIVGPDWLWTGQDQSMYGPVLDQFGNHEATEYDRFTPVRSSVALMLSM
jgi:hypothetical protein